MPEHTSWKAIEAMRDTLEGRADPAAADTPARPSGLRLRDVEASDLPIFFDHQRDPEARQVAAFTVKDPTDADGFAARWRTILADDTIVKQTIVFDGQVAGSVLSYAESGRREVAYWIGRESWGKGIATSSLMRLLDTIDERPLYARVAKDNRASLRVLEKCGFALCGEDTGFAEARGEHVEEFVLRLDGALQSPNP